MCPKTRLLTYSLYKANWRSMKFWTDEDDSCIDVIFSDILALQSMFLQYFIYKIAY
jgi:hypothetical protein